MNKYYIYCRKSSESEDRQILSIPAQIDALKEIAKDHALHVIRSFAESKSAKYSGRPDFNELNKRIEAEEGNAVLVWHPDRLSRNPEDSAKIISLMDAGKLLEVVTPTQTFRNNPMDKFMLGFFMMNAKLENDNKGVNVKRGLKAKAEKGWLPSGAKPGYTNDKYAEKGNKTIQNDPVRFPLIKQCWDLMLTGAYTVPQILEKLNNEWSYRTTTRKSIGDKPMGRSQIYRTFTDSFYYGMFEFPVGSSIWYKGSHEPMVTREEFDRVQTILGRPGKPRPKIKEFPLTGLIRCGECGAMATAEEKWQVICPVCKLKFNSNNRSACPKCTITIEAMRKPTLLHYIYYHCTKRKDPNCTQRSIRTEELEKQVDAFLAKIGISEEFKNWAIKYLNVLNDNEVETRNASLSSLQNAYNACVSRLDNLLKFKISPQNTDGRSSPTRNSRHKKPP
ncbi:recombinase family protein [Patescibacteria group bacterium]|nr:recombinase family protein [Patescibacteria group bacterium]MBU1473143.1 recombinase family protein [Patescibacteria group bacterium]MBU2459534.1 recombinase family protein [Patescibacteria group bacterium]